MPATLPGNPARAADWAEYVHKEIPYQFVEMLPSAQPGWEAYLRETYHGDIAFYRKMHQAEPVR